jgi:hypothetical protein
VVSRPATGMTRVPVVAGVLIPVAGVALLMRRQEASSIVVQHRRKHSQHASGKQPLIRRFLKKRWLIDKSTSQRITDACMNELSENLKQNF